MFTPVVLSILVTETAERFAYFGFRAVLVLYFTTNLFLDDNTAISMFAYTTCLANFSPIFGAALADGKLGRFRTILCFGCLYALGLMILTHAAFMDASVDVQELYKPHALDDSAQTLTWKRAMTCFGLILVCTGTGGIKPCVNIFGADQVALRDKAIAPGNSSNEEEEEEAANNAKNNGIVSEEEREDIVGRTATTKTELEVPNEDHAVREFFAFFYACINLGALSSYAFIPIVKKHYGFGMAFLLPTIFMCFAIGIFFSKRKEYIYRNSTEEGSSLLTTFKLCWRLIWGKTRQKLQKNRQRTCHTSMSQYDEEYVQEQELTRQNFSARTESFDDEPEFDSLTCPRQKTSSFGVDTAFHDQSLEDAKQALKILPVMAMLPMYWMLYDQQGSVWTLQASRMALHGLQPEQLNILNPLEIMLFIPLFDRVIYPYLESQNWNIAPLSRMGWGMVLTSASFVISGVLENVIENNLEGTIHVSWQVIQITIISIGEIFLSVTGLEYAYSKSPDRLKGFVMATYLLTTALGDLLGGVLYSSVFRSMNRALVMYVCAGLMLLNRAMFGWVVVATNQEQGATTTTIDQDSYNDVNMSEPSW